MQRMLCIGCSYTEGYPEFIDFTTKEAHHGKGLWFIERRLEEINLDKYNRIIIQLPTPIRFSADLGDTTDSISAFKRLRMTDDELLENYFQQIKYMSKKYKNAIFLLYNTGGYPLRYPWNFTIPDLNLVNYMNESNIPNIHVNLQGMEHATKSHNDMHPSEIADKRCAEIIKASL